MNLHQSMKFTVTLVFLLQVLSVMCDTRKSWKSAQPQEYLRALPHTLDSSSTSARTTRMIEEEITRVTRAAVPDTTTFQEEENTTNVTDENGFDEATSTDDAFKDLPREDEETTTTAADSINDTIKQGVRLLVTGKRK